MNETTVTTVKAAIAAAVATMTALWGWFGWLVIAWVLLMLADWLIGSAAAAKEGTLGFSLLNVESDSSSNMSESLNARSEAAVQAELERYYGKARALLAQNEAFLKEITEALFMKKTLLYSDIQAIRGTAVMRIPAVTCEAA